MQRAYCVLNMWPPIKIICNHLVTNASVLSVNTFLQKHRRRIKADNWCLWKEDSYIMFGRRRGHLSTNLYGLVTYTAPWKKLSFLASYRAESIMMVWGDPGGSGGSEKIIWKIFYHANFEIGTPGTPRGWPNIFFEKCSQEKLLGSK